MCKKIIDFSKRNEFRNLYSNRFESYLHEAFAEEKSISDLTLDFSGLVFIDVVTLINISSFVQYFLEMDKGRLRICLPSNKNVCTFLKYWNFKEGFENAAEGK